MLLISLHQIEAFYDDEIQRVIKQMNRLLSSPCSDSVHASLLVYNILLLTSGLGKELR